MAASIDSHNMCGPRHPDALLALRGGLLRQRLEDLACRVTPTGLGATLSQQCTARGAGCEPISPGAPCWSCRLNRVMTRAPHCALRWHEGLWPHHAPCSSCPVCAESAEIVARRMAGFTALGAVLPSAAEFQQLRESHGGCMRRAVEQGRCGRLGEERSAPVVDLLARLVVVAALLLGLALGLLLEVGPAAMATGMGIDCNRNAAP
jgi:hypothetical protein